MHVRAACRARCEAMLRGAESAGEPVCFMAPQQWLHVEWRQRACELVAIGAHEQVKPHTLVAVQGVVGGGVAGGTGCGGWGVGTVQGCGGW